MKENSTRKTVVTPGGARPSSQVTEVAAGATLTQESAGQMSVVEPQDDPLLVTPGGFRRRSRIHLIEPDTFLDFSKGRPLKIHKKTRQVLKEFEPIPPRRSRHPLMPQNVQHSEAPAALGSGWIAYSSWQNNTGQPVSLFATTWTVPPPPATQAQNLQTIFFFNGIQNSTMIYQPVLQWGPSADGGGPYWAVASWYVDGQGGPAHQTPLTRVNPGDVLVGVMTLTGNSGGGFDYTCEFQGLPASLLTVTGIPELTWCIETLEAYSITQCSDYPNANMTAMSQIQLQTGGADVNVQWQANNPVTDCGQHTVIVANGSPNGEVDLYY